MTFSNMTFKSWKYSIFWDGARKNRILTVIFNPKTTFSFLFFSFFSEGLLASFEKEFWNWPCSSSHLSVIGMKSPYHIIKCQCTKKQRAFFFSPKGTKLAFLPMKQHILFLSWAHQFQHCIIRQPAFHTETKPHLLWPSPHWSRDVRETKVSTESGPPYLDFSGLYPVLLSGYCQHFREFINEQHNHLLALNTNKHSTSTEEPSQT